MSGARRVAGIVVQAGAHRRRWCPVTAAVDLPGGEPDTRLALWDEANGCLVAHQLHRDAQGPTTVSFLVDELPAGWSRSYELRLLDAPVQPCCEGVRLSESARGALEVDMGGWRFCTYNFGPSVVRPYLYPVYAAPRTGVTRNWPMVAGVQGETNDHPHHKGIYTAQGAVNGVDNWGEGKGHGYQIHRAFANVHSGPVWGGFTEALDWTDSDRRANMSEIRRLRFYSTPLGLRMVDYEVELAAAHGNVTLGDTKEGGLLSIRVATSMDAARPGGGRILNGYGGIQEPETWGKRAPWCDYSGPIGAAWYGVCFMDHPGNPRHPTHWHVRDYGLMTANCFGIHDFTRDDTNRHDMLIEAGTSRRWTYRAIIHAGAGDFETLSAHYHDFANPPLVEVR